MYLTPNGIIRFSGVFTNAYPPILVTSGKMVVVEHANIILFEDFSIIELVPADLYRGLSFSTIMLLQYLLPRKEVESIRITDVGIYRKVIPNFAKASSPISFIPSTITEELHPETSLSFKVSTTALQFLRESYFLFLLSTTILT